MKDKQYCVQSQSMSTSSSPVRNSVSTIDSQGGAFVLVENDTDDILTILPDTELAMVELLSEEDSEEM
jgi:ATP-dependent 26S proteasome regulatory subunit